MLLVLREKFRRENDDATFLIDAFKIAVSNRCIDTTKINLGLRSINTQYLLDSYS